MGALNSKSRSASTDTGLCFHGGGARWGRAGYWKDIETKWSTADRQRLQMPADLSLCSLRTLVM